MITEEMKTNGIKCKGKSLNCPTCKDKLECVEYEGEDRTKCACITGEVFYTNNLTCEIQGNKLFIDYTGCACGAFEEEIELGFCPVCGSKLKSIEVWRGFKPGHIEEAINYAWTHNRVIGIWKKEKEIRIGEHDDKEIAHLDCDILIRPDCFKDINSLSLFVQENTVALFIQK